MSSLSLYVENLGVSYGAKRVLEEISFEVSGGSLVSIIGCNAGGKTTLLKALAGLVKRSGEVRIEEENQIVTTSVISYVPQLTQVSSRLSVFEMVLLGLVKNLSWSVSAEIFEKVDATLHALHIDHLSSDPVFSLSGGQKQLVFMAQAFVSKPRVLLLDEPTSALDLRHQLIVMQAARRYAKETGAVTVCVVHDLLTAARFSDRILLLDQGRVRLYDDPASVLKPDVLSDVYRVSVHVEQTENNLISVIPIDPL